MLSLRQPTLSATTSSSTTTATGNALEPTILEFSSLNESLDTFVSICADEFASSAAVKLCCSLPSYDEWSAGTDLDYHDLIRLQNHLIRFLRTAVQKLRAQKIHATYHLSPAQTDSSVALVRAVRPSPYSTCSSVWSDPACVNLDVAGLRKEAVPEKQRSKAFLASIGNVPTLITS